MSLPRYLTVLGAFLYIPTMEYFARVTKTREIKSTDKGTSTILHIVIPATLLLGLIFYFTVETGIVHLSETFEWLCIGVIALGYILRYWAMSILGEFFTKTLVTSNKQKVVTGGPYQVVRHPGYLANFLVHLVYSIGFTHNIICFTIVLTVLTLAYAARITAEEQMLETASFGAQYKEYKKHTWRIIPFVL